MALYVLAFDRIIYTNMGFSVRGQSMTSTRAPLMTSLPPARTKFPMDTMTSGYVIVMWAAQGNKNPGISRYSVWNSFNFAVIMYASNLFRTVAPVLRRTTANPQGTSSCLLFRITSPRPPSSLPSPPFFSLLTAANIKQRTGPNMGAIAIALVGVAGAYWIFGTKKAQDGKSMEWVERI